MIALPTINQTEGIEDVATCAKCGGRCCQSAAGIAYPDDFGPRETLIDVLVSYLKTGFWAVDWWEGDPRRRPKKPLRQVYFIRPAHTNAIGKLRDPSWGGQCRLWSAEYGCSLKFEQRPRTCRELVPNPEAVKAGPWRGKGCTFPGKVGTKEHVARAWIPFQGELIEALERVEIN